VIHIEFDMWSGKRKILLQDVLAQLCFSCNVSWTIYEFDGSGASPDGGSVVDFERKLLETSVGFQFHADGLEKFAREITDITDITLAGFCADKKIIEVVGVDSSSWEITADEGSVDVNKICANFAPKVQSSDWQIRD
jgi:hypothetical protein